MDWMRQYKLSVYVILVVSFITTICLALFLTWPTIAALIVMGTVSILYAVKINLGFGIKTNLRDLSGIKIILIALIWSGSCAILPAIQAESLDNKTLNFALGVGLYIIGITIPFDIRDLDVDEPQKKTLPQLLGIRNAKILGVVCVGFSLFLMGYNNYLNEIFLIPGILGSCFLIVLSKRRTSELYFSFLLDGMLLFLPGTYYLLKIL
jgi:4-hydroxybenzoate polyprenyltransferase